VQYVVLGCGAIGGTVAAGLARDGHDVLVADVDPAVVPPSAIRRPGRIPPSGRATTTARAGSPVLTTSPAIQRSRYPCPQLACPLDCSSLAGAAVTWRCWVSPRPPRRCWPLRRGASAIWVLHGGHRNHSVDRA